MKKTMRILAVLLALTLVFGTVAAVSASDTPISLSLYANTSGTKTDVTVQAGSKFDVYFGADKFSYLGDEINTAAIKIWYDPTYVEPSGTGENLIAANGVNLNNDVTDETAEFGGKYYSSFYYIFTSTAPGFGQGEEDFNPIMSLEFKAKKSGSTKIFISSENDGVLLLPVLDEAEPQKIISDYDFDNDQVLVEIKASKSDDGGGSKGGTPIVSSSHTVTFIIDGKITDTVVKDGNPVIPITTPVKEGFVFDRWYSDANCNVPYDFTQRVSSNLTLYGRFLQKTAPAETDPGTTQDGDKFPFTDVNSGDWFYDSVKYGWENKLVNGTTETTYSPNLEITRAMFVTILWRYDGNIQANLIMPYTDVPEGEYYTEAIRWAAAKGVVKGISETEFAPNDLITREQMAAIIYRYAQGKGMGFVGGWAFPLAFSDASEVSEYAYEPLCWTTMKGIITGKGDNMLAPKDYATRAEFITILKRFIEVE